VTTDDLEGLPNAHPRFAAHFTDPLYDDQGGEFAPFGTDEGADVLAEWAARRSELSESASLRTLLSAEGLDDGDFLADQPGREPDVGLDAAIIGAGFTLLRLTGQIDPEGREILSGALRRTVDFYGPQPELTRMLNDLSTFES
jgi:uncharacterized protein YfeS